MRTLVMVVGVVMLLVGGSGCRKRVSVFVPNTPEGNTCKRECMNVRASCSAGRQNERACQQREVECLTTCPGAVVDGNREEDLAPMKVAAPAPAASAADAPGATKPACVASELPEWQGASAAEKKTLLERCRAAASP